MAIRKEKYVDITSKVGGRAVAARRSLTGRVFTANPLAAQKGVVYYHSADEVLSDFGADSKEYKFAVKYFRFVSKTATQAEQISFVPWNYRGGAGADSWETYSVSCTQSEAVVEKDGKKYTYPNIVEAIAKIGDEANILVTLDSDVVYVSSATKANTARPFTDAVANDTEAVLDGIIISKKQHVLFDLNGHKLSFDRHCFMNRGFLQIDDSSKEKNGCCFTTNFANKVGPYPHVDSSWYPETGYAAADCILNTGILVINNGWFGTDEPTLEPRVNGVNWGLCLNISGGEATINGGHFTTVTNQQISGGGFATTLNTFLGTSSWIADATFTGAGKGPWAFIAETHFDGRLVVNDGIFYGYTNGVLGCVGDHGETTAEKYGAITVNGGQFYIGFPKEIEGFDSSVPGQCLVYAGTNGDFLIQWKYNVGDTITESKKTYTCQSMTLPSYLNGRQYKNATLSGSVVSTIRIYETFARAVVNGGQFFIQGRYSKIPFSGIVDIRGGQYQGYSMHHEDVNAEFLSNPQTISPIRYEKPVEAVSRIDALDDNFGSFCFMEALTPDEAREVAEWNAAKNFKYLYSLPVKVDNCKQILETVRDMSGTCYTLDKFDAFAEFMPMALFAATKYDRVNATKVFMYQQFDGERASVTTSQDADKYDAFDIDGQGTRFPVNYYGATQQAGSLINFYQDGYNADGLDTACYCNEIWLKDAISVELLNTFIALEKIPANNVGKAIVRNAIISVLHEGIRNETITVGKTLDNLQRAYVDRTAGLANAWENIESYGYWLTVDVKHRTLKGGRVQYYADYVLMYAKGDAIRKVEGSDILI